MTAVEASEGGASIVDHVVRGGELYARCMDQEATVERCRPVAERFQKHGTWWVPP